MKFKLSEIIVLNNYLFALFFLIVLPFPYNFIPNLGILDFIFGDLINFLCNSIFDLKIKNLEISSDSTSMYFLVLIGMIFSILISILILIFYDFSKINFTYLRFPLFVFLSFHLFIYGFDKLFLKQFYFPESNLLFTPLGNLTKDILFWSTIGTSKMYNYVTGFFEVFAGILLVVNRTKIIGLFLTLVILLNVVLINFSFDISVKIFSSFLLFITILLLFPYLKSCFQFIYFHENVSIKFKDSVFLKSNFLTFIGYSFFILVVFFETVNPFLNEPKKINEIQGAFKLIDVEENSNRMSECQFPIKRIFFHKNDYFIIQNQQDKMKDFKLTIQNKILILDDYDGTKRKINFEFNKNDSILKLNYLEKGNNFKLILKQENSSKLPIKNDQFHWSIEQIK